MNAKYLYRGKQINTGEWFYGNVIEKSSGSMVIHNDVDGDINVVSAETVGKCTDLLAAKSYRGENEADRLIFEGDLVRLPKCDNDVAEFKRVANSPNFYLKGIKNNYSIAGWNLDSTDACPDCYEIVGNIHDMRTEGEMKYKEAKYICEKCGWQGDNPIIYDLYGDGGYPVCPNDTCNTEHKEYQGGSGTFILINAPTPVYENPANSENMLKFVKALANIK